MHLSVTGGTMRTTNLHTHHTDIVFIATCSRLTYRGKKSDVAHVNRVTLRGARLLLGWVTSDDRCGNLILIYLLSVMETQPLSRLAKLENTQEVVECYTSELTTGNLLLNCFTLPSFYYRRALASIALNFYCRLGSWGFSPPPLSPW